MSFPFQGSHSKLSPLERKNIYLRPCSNCNLLLNLFICTEHNSSIQERFTTLHGTQALMMKRQMWFLLSWDSQHNRVYKQGGNQGPGCYWSTWEEHLGAREGSVEEMTSTARLWCGYLLGATDWDPSRRRTGTRYWNRETHLGVGYRCALPEHCRVQLPNLCSGYRCADQP